MSLPSLPSDRRNRTPRSERRAGRTGSALHAGEPRPFADRAPAFDAVVPGDLPRCGYSASAQRREIETGRRLHQTAHLQRPVGKSVAGQRLIFKVVGHRGAIAAKGRRQLCFAELLRHRFPRGQQALRARERAFRAAQHFREPFAAGQRIAPGEQQEPRGAGEGVAQEMASINGSSSSSMCRWHLVTPGHHRAQIVPQTADDDLEHVNQHKRTSAKAADKMNGARGLPSAQYIDPGRKRRIESRRHRPTAVG